MPKKAETRAQKVIRFIESYCLIPEGDSVGQPLILESFQKSFIKDVYDNPHGTRHAYLSMARKNAKTTTIACLVLAHVAGPEKRQNSQIISGAQSRDQAALVYNLAAKMVMMSPDLSAIIRIVPSSKTLIGLIRNVTYKAISAEGKTAHGHSPVVAILDEVGQVRGSQDDFVDAIITAQGAYKDSLLLAISTQAPNDVDLFSIWLDDARKSKDPHTICHVYEAPKECALDDREAWLAANPALGKFRSLQDVVEQSKRAKRMPSAESSFRNLILNQRVESFAPFVSKSIWATCGKAPEPLTLKTKVWAGLDLGSVADLCSFEALTENGGVHSAFWLPGEGIEEKSKQDREEYDVWARQGFLNLTPGRSVEYLFIAEYLRTFFNSCDVQKVAFDRYNMRFLRPYLVAAGFTEKELLKFVEFGQGFVSMSPALRDFESRLLQGTLCHGMHPVLTMCARNATIVKDQTGNRKFAKHKVKGRIDGMVALAMAIGVAPADKPPVEPTLMFM